MQLEIIYWRDIPAQCTLRAGRKRHGVALPERFERAIDRCAMRAGLRDSDAYLQQWRRAPGREWTGAADLPEAMREARAMIEADYPDERLRRLIDQKGFEAAPDEPSPPSQPPQPQEPRTP